MRIPYRLLASIGLATAGLAAMADPAPVLFGGWRNLATAADAGYVEENMAFAMLPAVVARGTRMAVLDEERKQTVCCLEVVSVPLEDSLLRHRFDLPGVWVSDLRNDWNIDHRPYLPRCSPCNDATPWSTITSMKMATATWGACSSRPMHESRPRARCTPVARRSSSTSIPSRWPTTTAR